MKIKYLSAFLLIALVTGSCSCERKPERSMPTNPTPNQQWRDNNGNTWMWAAAGYWIGSSMSSGGSNYYYYPSQNYYTTTPGGERVNPPSSITSGITPTRSKVNTSKTNSTSRTTTSTTSSTKRSSFGSTGRSSSSSRSTSSGRSSAS